ncbi:MAG: pitrilysin family protein [Candidatus Omnitrophica bacterium]|nr:pitrilysin family protein [Candidatus Omnitrophota bacterium]
MHELVKFTNGMKLVTAGMPFRDSVAVGIWVKVGGRYEKERISGISHFVEHLLFKGTRKRSARDLKEAVEGLGGVFNAFTSEEATCYFIKIVRKHLALALDILSDMVHEPLFRKEDIERERSVIIEELRMYRDLPSHYVHELVNELLWPDQPLGRALVGSEETVGSISRSDIVKFKDAFYHPSNLLAVICGEIDHDEAFRQTARFFPETTKRKPSQFERSRVRQTKPQFDIRDKDTEQTHFVIGFHGLSRCDEHRFQLGLLNIILGANMSSRLYEEVREKHGLAYEIRSHAGYHQDTGYFTISAGVEPRKTPFAMRLILKELVKIKSALVTKDELQRAKDYFIGQFYLMLEDTLDNMLWVGERAMYLGKVPTHEEIRREIERVTLEDIQQMAEAVLRSNHMNMALIGPVKDKLKTEIVKDFHL